MLAPAGPAVTMDPVCPVFTVERVYAVGPATEATKLSPTAASAS